MKVKELIEKLQAFDGDDVVIEALDSDMLDWDDELPGIRVFKPEQCVIDTRYRSSEYWLPAVSELQKGKPV
jgi:hypothetical protein